MESSRQEIGAGFVLFVIFSACLSDVKVRESPEFPKKKKQDDYATGTSGHSVDMVNKSIRTISISSQAKLSSLLPPKSFAESLNLEVLNISIENIGIHVNLPVTSSGCNGATTSSNGGWIHRWTFDLPLLEKSQGQQQDFSCPMLNAASSSNNSSKVQCFCNLTFLKDVKTLMSVMSLVLAQSPRFAEMRLAAGIAIDMCSENLQLRWASQVWPSVSNPSNETWFYLSCETDGT
ncbi:hypothetical protein NC652_014521 [Populus alba x Populus x berolinensis]|nr:hypothetical protein NC652_014521 [Populus alba x Populus x berolinensis]